MNNKWDKRYQNKTSVGDCCWLLKHFSHLLPQASGSVLTSLDVACGTASNALALAHLGFISHAWDNSIIALQKAQLFASQQQLDIITSQRNLEKSPPDANSFDVIVVSQYLHRPLCHYLSAALKPGGILFYQTFHNNKLTAKGPSNPNFLLNTNELLNLFSNLDLLFYREERQQGDLQIGLRDMAYFIARKA